MKPNSRSSYLGRLVPAAAIDREYKAKKTQERFRGSQKAQNSSGGSINSSLQLPRAKLKRKRKLKKQLPQGEYNFTCADFATAAAVMLMFSLLLLNEPFDPISASSHHKQLQIKLPKWQVAAMEVKGEVRMPTNRNDDISMINEGRLLVQDSASTGKEQEEPGRASKSSVQQRHQQPVDVDVGDKINQYKRQIQQQLQEEAARIKQDKPPRWVGSRNEKKKKKNQEKSEEEGGRGEEETHELLPVARLSRARRSKRLATMLADTQQTSDGSSAETTTTTSNKTAEETTTTEQHQQQEVEESLKCRLEKDFYMPFGQYKHYACANCYGMMPDDLFSERLIFRKELKGLLLDRRNNKLVITNETSLIKETFLEERTFSMWQACCESAIDCCRKNSIYLPQTIDSSSGELIDDQSRRDVCPATWDGFSCWPDTPAGQMAVHDCPWHLYFLEFEPVCPNQVTKQCFPNGSWYIKNGHEWSNYSRCDGQELYQVRLLITAFLHTISFIVVGPSLLVLGKMRQRFETRRVYILRWLLFWLLLNSLFTVFNRMGIVLRIFHDVRPAQLNPRDMFIRPTAAASKQHQPPTANLSNARTVRAAVSELTANNWTTGHQSETAANGDTNKEDVLLQNLLSMKRTTTTTTTKRLDDDSYVMQFNLHNDPKLDQEQIVSQRSGDGRARRMLPTESTQLNATQQQQQQDNRTREHHSRHQQPFWIVVLCWFSSTGVQVARLFGYAWMCTSAIYLCSVLHFSPAEPPPLLMGSLMFVTHALPLVLSLTYIIARNILEPSPLTQLIEVPYHYISGDLEYAEHLRHAPVSCWMRNSNSDFIADIIEKPNFVLVLLNTGLFVITLIIMCRFKKLPGSTRPETSLWGYFKAAGMLVFLYGAHYLLLMQSPSSVGRSCQKDQVLHYAQIIVDSVQGIAVSLVFCYRTSAGKEVISKWWNNFRDKQNSQYCADLCRRPKPARYQRSLLKQNSRSNRSTGSSNSNCNGIGNGKDLATELSNVNVNSF